MKSASELWTEGEVGRLTKEVKKQSRTIVDLKHNLALLSGQAASMSNTLTDCVSKMNNLAHYIIENKHSTDVARICAEDILDFITSIRFVKEKPHE